MQPTRAGRAFAARRGRSRRPRASRVARRCASSRSTACRRASHLSAAPGSRHQPALNQVKKDHMALIGPGLLLLLLVVLAVSSLRGAARIPARRRVPARPFLEGEGPRARDPRARHPADGARRASHRRARRAEPGRDFARQRVGEGERGRLFPRGRSAEGDHRGRELHDGDEPARADDAALGARQARPRRDAVAAREAQHRHPADARRADAVVGHQGRQRRDQARRHQRIDDSRDRAPGRSRARAAREGDPRRRRDAGGAEAVRGGARCWRRRRWRSSSAISRR